MIRQLPFGPFLGIFQGLTLACREASSDKVLGKGVGAPDSTEASTALELFFAPPRPPRSIYFGYRIVLRA